MRVVRTQAGEELSNADLGLRREWDTFRERFERAGITPTRQDILAEATRIDDKFGHMFIPKER